MSKAEKFISKSTRHFSNEWYDDLSQGYEPWLSPDEARMAVEIAKEEMIEWIKDNIEQYPVDNWDRFVNSLITDLKQAMKDEEVR